MAVLDCEAGNRGRSFRTTEPGFTARAALVARYADRTGRDVTAMRFYQASALYRVSVIEQQIYDRFSTSQPTEERFAAFESRARRLAEAALEVVEGRVGHP